MKNTAAFLFYILFSLTTLTLSAQRIFTEVASEKSQGSLNKLGVSKKSGDSTCISVSLNSDSLQQGQQVIITIKSCQDLEMLKVMVSGDILEINDKGVAEMSRKSGMIGIHNIPVSIVSRGKDGNLKTESYTITYQVSKALSQ